MATRRSGVYLSLPWLVQRTVWFRKPHSVRPMEPRVAKRHYIPLRVSLRVRGLDPRRECQDTSPRSMPGISHNPPKRMLKIIWQECRYSVFKKTEPWWSKDPWSRAPGRHPQVEHLHQRLLDVRSVVWSLKSPNLPKFLSILGLSPSWIESARIRTPPGRSTRAASFATSRLVSGGSSCSRYTQVIASNDASGNGIFSAWACTYSQLPSVSFPASSWTSSRRADGIGGTRRPAAWPTRQPSTGSRPSPAGGSASAAEASPQYAPFLRASANKTATVPAP